MKELSTGTKLSTLSVSIETAARTLSQAAPLIRFRQNRKTMLEQSDHHAHIASFLGTRCVVSELNKMDHVEYCEDFFLHLQLGR